MSIFKKISNFFYYYLDSFKAKDLIAKIEHFNLGHDQQNIVVAYRLGRQRLLHTMNLSLFQKEYFKTVSNYDQQRLTKFSTLQFILQDLLYDDSYYKKKLITFIQEHIKNEQLF